LRFLALIVTLISGLPSVVHATDIAKPHFVGLVESADAIVIGTVTYILPSLSYYWPFIVYGAGFAVVGCLLLRRLQTRAGTAPTAVMLFLIGLAVAYFLLGGSDYRKVATIAVSQVVKGEIAERTVKVSYDLAYRNDLTQFTRGAEYVLFLRARGSKWSPAWLHWGVWEVTGDCVTTEALKRNRVPPKPFADFLTRVRGIMDDPTNPEFAGIQSRPDGTKRHYRIHEDPFFNPKVRRSEEKGED